MNSIAVGKAAGGVVVVGAMLIGAWDAHTQSKRSADALETLVAESRAAQEPQHMLCKQQNVVEKNGGKPLDLGVPVPCGGDSLGQCLRGLPLSEWAARCEAGKVP